MLIESMTCIFPPYLLFLFLFVILPFLPSFISSSSCVCACLSPSIFRQTTMLAPNASLSHISHTVSYSCLYPITGASNHVCRTNSHIKCWRIRPFFVSHSHSHSDSLPPTPTPIPNTSPPHLPKRPDIILSMTRSRFLPHAHTYISFPLRYDTASVGVIFISILVTFLELDTLAFTISKHLTIRVYCFLPIHLVNVHTAPKPRCSA